MAQLLSGYCGETINSTISRLYRKADFDLDRASRGLVFLDGMHKIGENQGLSKVEQQQVLREVMQIVEGQVPVDVTRAGSASMEVLNTSNMFFVCFGVFEAEEQLLNQDADYEDDFEVIEEAEEEEEEDFKALNESNNNDVVAEKDRRRDSRTSVVSMDTSSSVSNASSNKSPEIVVKRRGSGNSDRIRNNNNNHNNNNMNAKAKGNVKKDDKKGNKNKNVMRSVDSDLSSTGSSRDEWSDDWFDDADDSFQGLKENKLARLVTESENSPIRHYQTLWGMKDVDLKFTPEALEIIANQVSIRHTTHSI